MLPLLLTLATAAPPVVTVGDGTGIVVDGVLDDEAWQAIAPVTEFAQFQPVDGGPPPGTTEVRFAQDDRYLYASIVVSDVDYRVRARVSQREDINDDDQIGIYLDTFQDQRSGYIFYLNALGVQQDFRRNADTYTFSWDAVFKSEGTVTDTGYVLEVAWPWRSLRYASDATTWGLLLTRKVPHDNAKYGFPEMERGNPRPFTQAATLAGLRPPPAGTGLELLPQLTVIQSAVRDEQGALDWAPWNPVLDVVRPSLDARLGITPNLGLAATLNPDFSQVEFDVTPTALNQRFAFFFQERRPFFLDGAEYFSDPLGTLYTRTMVEPVAGLKLSGRAGPAQVGVLSVLDRSPAASIHERPTPGFMPSDTEDALALTSFARAQYDVGQSGTVGATVADKHLWQRGTQSGTFQQGGVDALLPLGGRWTLSMAHSQSRSQGSGDALWGTANQIDLQRRSGVGTGMRLYGYDSTPGYRLETGFMPQSGLTQVVGELDHTFEPKGAIDTLTPSVGVDIFEERNGDGYRSAGGGVDIVVDGVHTAGMGAFAGTRTEGEVTTDEWIVGVDGGTVLGRALQLTADGTASRVLDFDTLSPARILDGGLDVVLRPTAGIRLDLGSRLTTLTPLVEQLPVEHATRLRARLAWQFTKPLGVRLLAEHNAGNVREPSLLSSLLVTWLHHPGTAVWLGYTEVTGLEGKPQARSRAVFAKVSVLLRP